MGCGHQQQASPLLSTTPSKEGISRLHSIWVSTHLHHHSSPHLHTLSHSRFYQVNRGPMHTTLRIGFKCLACQTDESLAIQSEEENGRLPSCRSPNVYLFPSADILRWLEKCLLLPGEANLIYRCCTNGCAHSQ